MPPETPHDIREILDILPHRFPFLLVDRLTKVDFEERRCSGIKNVTFNELHFLGHYPGMPVMPGVLILEAIAQVGAACILQLPEYKGLIPLIGAFDNVKFKRVVIPGDQLKIDTHVQWFRGSIGKMDGQAYVDGELATSMEMTFKLKKQED